MRFTTTKLIFLFFFFVFLQSRSSMAATLGGLRPSGGCENSLEIEDLARFAVQEHNKNQNKMLEFARLVKAEEQTVAGTMHHLTLEAVYAGKKMIYEAKVWVKPWLNFKELQDFKHTGEAEAEAEAEAEPKAATPSFTSSDLGVKKDGHPLGWRSVPAHDPVVKDAANHALTSLQQRSNSLFPYELQEVVHAKAEVIDDHAKFDILLKVKRGTKEEKYKVEVHKNNQGNFVLNQVEQDSST